MAQVDLEVRDFLLSYSLPLLLPLTILLLILTDSLKDVRKRFFRWAMRDFSATHEDLTSGVREALFSDLPQLESRVLELRNKGLLRILEIGVGAGKNLKFFPQQCRLIVVDPSPYFKQYYEENKAKFRDICLEKFVISGGESLRGVPSNHVDVVVTSTVLCSVQDVRQTLKEIRRVLVPGGRYYFLEHLLDEHDHKRCRIQKLLTQTRIWPWLFDGCRFLPLREEICSSGFSKVDYQGFQLDPSGLKGKVQLFARLMAPHVVGVARK